MQSLATYLREVRAEMKRVTWPTKKETRNMSVGTIVILIVFGLVLWAIDMGIVAGLAALAGIR